MVTISTGSSGTGPGSIIGFSRFRAVVGGRIWVAGAVLIALALCAPILGVLVAAAADSRGLWFHLLDTVLPWYVANTLILMMGVGTVSLIFGVSAAWTVTRYDFPGRRWLAWMLLLPAAVPAYLIAYTYTDFLEFAGPVQGALRAGFGWTNARDYWFPEIRSMGGASLIMGAVLYPYIYMLMRVALLLTPASLFEIGMLKGRNLFWSVALPLSRPAIVAGLALVTMETVSDFGTVEYFAIETLTLGIFNVWLGQNSLAAAAQMALFAFLLIIILLVVETLARARRRFTDPTRRATPLQAMRQSGYRAALSFAICAVPIIIGFIVPVGVLVNFIIAGHSLDPTPDVLEAALNTVLLAGGVAGLVMASATFLGLVGAFKGGAWLRRLVGLASLGYAFPGTILAIGTITVGGAVDDAIAAMLERILAIMPGGAGISYEGWSYEGWLASGVGLVLVACVARFQAVGYGAVRSGLERLPPNVVDAGRVLGYGFAANIRAVIVPLLRLSLIAGGLLVFVDVMKELPMTLLLRPFDFETLATYVYQFASEELLEEAALPALMIVATGIVPVVVMNMALAHIAGRHSRTGPGFRPKEQASLKQASLKQARLT